MEDVIEAGIGSGAFEGGDVEGFFDDADGGLVAVGVGADVAGGFFGDVGAGLAELDALLDAVMASESSAASASGMRTRW